MNNATNHSLDRGTEGVEASTSNLRERGMLYTGSFASPQDRAKPRIIGRNGLKVGFLAYTENEPGLGVWFSHGNFLHGQYDERTKYGGIGEYTITRHRDGSLSLGKIRFMPTYTVGRPQTPEYKVIPLADATDLPWVDPQISRADIEALMNTYTPVEVVDYLD